MNSNRMFRNVFHHRRELGENICSGSVKGNKAGTGNAIGPERVLNSCCTTDLRTHERTYPRTEMRGASKIEHLDVMHAHDPIMTGWPKNRIHETDIADLDKKV